MTYYAAMGTVMIGECPEGQKYDIHRGCIDPVKEAQRKACEEKGLRLYKGECLSPSDPVFAGSKYITRIATPTKTSAILTELAKLKESCAKKGGKWHIPPKSSGEIARCIYPTLSPPTMQIQSCPPSCPPGWSKEGYPPWHPSHPSQKKGITLPINTLLLGAVILLLLK